MSLRDEMSEEAQKYGAGGSKDFFRFDKSGVYRLRLLTKGVALATHFFGKGVPSSVCYGQDRACPFHMDDSPSVKFIAYVLDRSDGKVKLGEFPWSVFSALADFQDDEDYKFDDYPMPYDIKVTVDKESKDPKSIYKTLASPKREKLTADEIAEVEEKYRKITPEQFVEKRKEKQLEKHKEDGTHERELERRKKLAEEIETAKAEAASRPTDYPDEVNPEDIPF